MLEKERGWLRKKDFNAGSPYSCWLREEMYGEVTDKSRGLVKKYGVRIHEEEANDIIMSVKKLDDYPDGLRKVAIDVIRMELDEDFMKNERKTRTNGRKRNGRKRR